MNDQPDREELIRSLGPAHINLYAHGDCAAALKTQIATRGQVVDPEATMRIPAEQLIGRWKDITHCDQCGEPFGHGDQPYVRLMAMDPEELRLWQKVRAEQSR